MSKAKDEYSKQVAMISFTSHYSTGPIVNYVTELEKKAEMFGEMVKCIATAVDLLGDCNAYYEIGEDILDRAKKLQEEWE